MPLKREDFDIKKVEKLDLTFVVTSDEWDADLVIYDNDSLEVHCVLEVVSHDENKKAVYKVVESSDLLRSIYMADIETFTYYGPRDALVKDICTTIASQIYVETLDVQWWSIVYYN